MEARVTLRPEDLARARLLVERQTKPITRPWVRAGMLLTASLLFLAILPCSIAVYGSGEFSMHQGVWLPLLMFLLFFAAGIWAGARLPKLEEEGWKRRYATDALRLESARIVLYRDSFTVETPFQRFTENWVDFDRCYESRDFFVASGGKNYRMLVLPKAQLSPEQQEQAAACLQNYFAYRYRKV